MWVNHYTGIVNNCSSCFHDCILKEIKYLLTYLLTLEGKQLKNLKYFYFSTIIGVQHHLHRLLFWKRRFLPRQARVERLQNVRKHQTNQFVVRLPITDEVSDIAGLYRSFPCCGKHICCNQGWTSSHGLQIMKSWVD